MKYSLLALLLLATATLSASPLRVSLTAQCNGSIGNIPVQQTLQFGNGVNVADIAKMNGVVFSMQVSSDKGQYDMLILKNNVDASGNRQLATFVVGHGATELDYIDNEKATTIVCVLNSDL